ncbi:MAG: ABC transporter ATP-binding protein [Myxococcota bacterium]
MLAAALRGVKKSFGPVEVVRGVDLDVAEGEIVALLGGSGCGKTTTLRMIAGLDRPTGGSIAIAGEPVSDDHTFVPPEARRIGMVFQSYAVWPHLTVLQNVTFPLERRGARDPIGAARVALERVQLTGFEDRRPHQLSGGQQQRVALARALVGDPRLLLLDEPLSNLDARLRGEVRDEIRALVKRAGLTAILVTHDHEEAFAIADRIALMHGGGVQQYGEPRALYDSPSHDVVARFFGVEELPGRRVGDTVVVGDAAIPVHATADAPADGPAALGFRIEHAHIAPVGIPAVVVASTWLGREVHSRVRIGEREVRVSGAGTPGAAVRVAVDRGFALAAAGR